MTLVLNRPSSIVRPTSGASGITLYSAGASHACILRPGGGALSSESRDIANASFLRDRLALHTGHDNSPDDPAFFPVFRDGVSLTVNVVGTTVSSPSNPFTNYICLGFGATAAALGVTESTPGTTLGGVVVRTVGNALIIAGYDHIDDDRDTGGNRYAILQFLHDVLGYRHFWPGPLGEIIPVTPTLTLPTIDIWRNPILKQRIIRQNPSVGGAVPATGVPALGFDSSDWTAQQASWVDEWASHQQLGGALYEGGSHGFTNYWTDFGATHPAWFAEQNMTTHSRDQSALSSASRARLCKANPELQDHKAAELIAALDADPDSAVEVGSNDGGNMVNCRCTATLATPGYPSVPGCVSLDPDIEDVEHTILLQYEFGGPELPSVPMSDRQFTFWREIAEPVKVEHPDATFVASAYSFSQLAPTLDSGPFNANFALLLLGGSWRSEVGRLLMHDAWTGWAARRNPAYSLQMFYRPNILYTEHNTGLIAAWPHMAGQDFRIYATGALAGTDFDAMLGHWATQGFAIYALSRLMWNPADDIDALLTDYITKAFGAAAVDSLRSFFARVEQVGREGYVYVGPPTTVTGDLVSGDNTLTSSTGDFTADDVGKAISGVGISGSTYIASRTSATSVEMSQPANASGTNVAVLISGRGLQTAIDFYTPEINTELLGYLDAADAAGSPTADEQARITWFRKGFESHEITCRIRAMYLDRTIDPPTAGERDALGDEWYALMRDIFENYHFAVNAAYLAMAAGSEPYGPGFQLATMGWTP